MKRNAETIAIALFAIAMVGIALSAYRWAYGNGWNAANARAEQVIGEFMAAEAAAQAKVRESEQAIANAQAEARDEAESRNAQIQSDYERRLSGADAERDRLQEHWRACATDRLSAGAAAAGEIAAADRLRRDSAARIVRAAEFAQSERDEVIGLYRSISDSGAGVN